MPIQQTKTSDVSYLKEIFEPYRVQGGPPVAAVHCHTYLFSRPEHAIQSPAPGYGSMSIVDECVL
jgi:hypothetical protein